MFFLGISLDFAWIYSSFIKLRTVSLYTPLGFSDICINSCNTPAVTEGRFVRIIAHWFVSVILSIFPDDFAGVASSSWISSDSSSCFVLDVSFERLSSCTSSVWSSFTSISGIIDFNVVINMSIFSWVIGSVGTTSKSPSINCSISSSSSF